MLDLIGALSALATGTQAVDSIVNIYEWLKRRVATGSTPPELINAIQALPTDATADEISAVVAPFVGGKGGDAELAAGDNGGGDVVVHQLDMAAGDGPSGGGKAIVRGGRGGPEGVGGRLTIVSGTIRGGNASEST